MDCVGIGAAIRLLLAVPELNDYGAADLGKAFAHVVESLAFPW
jgi:hypothetical protein